MKNSDLTVPLENNAADRLSLEDIVHLANKIGLEFVNAKKEVEKLELGKNTLRSQLITNLDDGTLSETKLKRLAEIDSSYLEHMDRLINARAEYERLRIRYDSYKNLFDARRSLLSFQKAEMKLV